MYCKIFTSRQVYDGMTEISIACDNVFVTDGWICLYKDEKFVASFDMASMNGWVLIDSETIDDYVKRKAEPQKKYPTEWCENCELWQDNNCMGVAECKRIIEMLTDVGIMKDEPQTERSE